MSFLTDFFAAFVSSRRRALAIHDLEALSPAQLRDIGYAPDGLDGAVDGLLGPSGSASHGRRMQGSLLGTHPLAGMTLRTCG
jgi:hypothetical protein